MTTVLIAVDDSDDAVETAATARRLFGDTPDYYVINVGQVRYPAMVWGASYPMMGAAAMYPQMWPRDSVDADVPSAEDDAENRAANVAGEASLPHARALGDIGDPATAILRAAHEHGADVVVVGSHEHSWLGRLFLGSVSDDVVKAADIPVLVIK